MAFNLQGNAVYAHCGIVAVFGHSGMVRFTKTGMEKLDAVQQHSLIRALKQGAIRGIV